MILPQESQQEYNIKVNTERSGRIGIFWRKRTGDVQIQDKNTRNGSYLDILFILALADTSALLGFPSFDSIILNQASENISTPLKIAQACHGEKGESEVNFASC